MATYEKENPNLPQKSKEIDHHTLEKHNNNLFEQVWTVLSILGITFMVGFCIVYKFYLKRKSKKITSMV